MLNFTPHSGRARLEFTQAVRSAFQFLERDYGMTCVRVEEPTFVRYESETGFVNVYHGRNDYHVGVEIGRWIMQNGEQAEESVPLYTILGSIARDFARSMHPQAESREDVQQKVAEAAELVRRFGAAALRGETIAFQRALLFGDQENSRLEHDAKYIWQIRKSAQQAWKQSDYREVARLLDALGEKRTEEESDRLEYAMQRITSDDE